MEVGKVVRESSQWLSVCDTYCLWPVGFSCGWQYSVVLLASVIIIYLSGRCFWGKPKLQCSYYVRTSSCVLRSSLQLSCSEKYFNIPEGLNLPVCYQVKTFSCEWVRQEHRASFGMLLFSEQIALTFFFNLDNSLNHHQNPDGFL